MRSSGQHFNEKQRADWLLTGRLCFWLPLRTAARLRARVWSCLTLEKSPVREETRCLSQQLSLVCNLETVIRVPLNLNRPEWEPRYRPSRFPPGISHLYPPPPPHSFRRPILGTYTTNKEHSVFKLGEAPLSCSSGVDAPITAHIQPRARRSQTEAGCYGFNLKQWVFAAQLLPGRLHPVYPGDLTGPQPTSCTWPYWVTALYRQ